MVIQKQKNTGRRQGVTFLKAALFLLLGIPGLASGASAPMDRHALAPFHVRPSVFCGYEHSVYLKSDGTHTQRLTPVQIQGLTDLM